MNERRYPLDFETRAMVGAVCWAIVLVLFAALLGDFAMIFVWPYVLISAVLVFAYVLEGPPEEHRDGELHTEDELHTEVEPEPVPETPKELIARIVDETMHEAALLHEACEQRPELADQIRDMYAQKFHAEKEGTP